MIGQASMADAAVGTVGKGGTEGGDRFTFTLALAATTATLVAWFEQAQAGETVTYASGFTLPREAEAVKLVQAWQREGLVHLKQARDEDDRRRWLFLAERSSQGPKPPRLPRDRSDDITAMQLRRLFDLLRAAADKGEPIPGRRWLARHLTGDDSRKGMNRVTYLLGRLDQQGKIALTPAPIGAQHGPTVTIRVKGRGFGKTTTAVGREQGK